MRSEFARRRLAGFGELGDAGLGEFARAFEIGPGGVRLLQGGGEALVLLLDGLELLAPCRQSRTGLEQLLELRLSGRQHLVQILEPGRSRLCVFLRLRLGAHLPARLRRLNDLDARQPFELAGRHGAGLAGAEHERAQARQDATTAEVVARRSLGQSRHGDDPDWLPREYRIR